MIKNLIIGLGKTGLSCARCFAREGKEFAVVDSRQQPPGFDELQKIAPNVVTCFGEISPTLVNEAERLVVSPGVSLKESVIDAAVKRGVPFCGDIELFAERISLPVIAITGANAKSTVTVLVGEMVKASGIDVCVAGNIGLPVLDTLVQSRPLLYVLELSSFQLETTFSLKPIVSTILNISEDHLDRYSSLDEYIAAKKRIYKNCRAAVVNLNDRRIWPDYAPNSLRGFSLQTPQENQYGLLEHRLLAKGNQPFLSVDEVKMQGMHNIENALAALAIGDGAHLGRDGMIQTLKTFGGLPHRCQLVRNENGVSWYNDSKATNVGAVVAALEGLGNETSKNIVLIAGGKGKGLDLSLLRPAMQKYVRHLIVIGETSQAFIDQFHDIVSVDGVSSMQNAVALAQQIAQTGDRVLLSPACASFDMFENYEHRGRVFEECVEAL